MISFLQLHETPLSHNILNESFSESLQSCFILRGEGREREREERRKGGGARNKEWRVGKHFSDFSPPFQLAGYTIYDQLPALVWDSILNLTIYPTRLTYAPWPKLKYKSTVLCDAKRYGRRFTHYSEAIVNVQKVKWADKRSYLTVHTVILLLL
jgi:hypothetical protein